MTIPWIYVHIIVLQMRHGSWLFVAAVGILVCRLLIKYTVAAHKFAGALATRAVLNTQDDKSTPALSHSFIQLKI
ncbi:hypothetical protein V8C40DRAFT_237440 [Trichoderma camerunense]